MKFAIVDDNEGHAQEIEELIYKNIRFIETDVFDVFIYTDEMEFLSNIKNGTRFDIIFIDIVLNYFSGIDVGETVNSFSPGTKIIFISVSNDFFKEAYRAEHCWFLTKPIEENLFVKALKKAAASLQRNYIALPVKSGSRKINLGDLLYLESCLKKTKFYYSDGHIDEYPFRLTEIEGLLPKHIFIRTHQSYIINIRKYTSSARTGIYMERNIRIPISRRFVHEIETKLSLYSQGLL